ncbi:3'(2'),5'-bisphosphate nucleotidase [Dactylococcopsis salina]|uniref:3'(2'),5'-bisphosphate nucleotidase, HAL2 family n=1 Tax=Dactylococcopsis salina (strain PCC 8305) TaxID=13035 RepID=K9YU71_DACS8|nr:3'(2'),5'-bisphosphate nucleotidase [Dactylococcopsis salina]AFZ49653.1 3'(2'),5'-bisphosphate nucleotidase, HAL2 family [Dactylococcopsis salina PCC 8305]
MAYEKELQVGIEASLSAAKLCQAVRGNIPDRIEKQDRSPVTIADFGSQAIICRALAEAFPNDPVVGEEDATALRSSEMSEQLAQVTEYVKQEIPNVSTEDVTQWIDHGNGEPSQRFWTLDPIDGTKGFLRGDQYAIALALIEEGEVKVGILACPALSLDLAPPLNEEGLLFVAVRGEGTKVRSLKTDEFTAIRVASPDDEEHLRFVESVEVAHGDQSQQSAIAQQAGIKSPSLRMDSQAKYGAVASGAAALYLRLPSPKQPDYRENIWDHAAGVIVAEEAGGRASDMYGKPLDFSVGAKLFQNRGVVVSNGSLHEAVLAALNK